MELRRTTVTEERAKYGPGNTRILTSAEAAAEALRRVLGEAKKDRFGTAIKAARVAISLGLIDLGLGATAKLPTGLKLTGELSKDAAEYRKRRREFALGRAALRQIVWKEIMGPGFADLDAQRPAHPPVGNQ